MLLLLPRRALLINEAISGLSPAADVAERDRRSAIHSAFRPSWKRDR